MTESTADFRVVLRGFDPAQVQTRLRGLEAEIERLRTQDTTGTEQVPSNDPASYEQLGRRMVQILTLAREEAQETRETVAAEVTAARASAEEDAERMREHARLEAETTRADAEAAAHRTIEGARATASDLLDAAEREAATRRQEAEAIVELQRAKAVEANADFELAMSQRREVAEKALRDAENDARARLDELERRIATQEAETAAERADAQRESRRILEDAQAHADALVNEAKVTADRVRAEAEREIAAATQRRDSINDQLANLREMLSTLTGSPAGGHDLNAP